MHRAFVEQAQLVGHPVGDELARLRTHVDPHPSATQPLGSQACGRATGERIEHRLAEIGTRGDDSAEQRKQRPGRKPGLLLGVEPFEKPWEVLLDEGVERGLLGAVTFVRGCVARRARARSRAATGYPTGLGRGAGGDGVTDVRLGGMVAERHGAGPAVVMVHGLGGSSGSFELLMPALDGYCALRPDLPGAGRSALRPGRPGIAGLAGAVRECMRAAGAARAHLVGHSMGALICQHLAADAPEAVASLALFGALLEPAPAARAALAERAREARRTAGMAGIAEAVSAGSVGSRCSGRRRVRVRARERAPPESGGLRGPLRGARRRARGPPRGDPLPHPARPRRGRRGGAARRGEAAPRRDRERTARDAARRRPLADAGGAGPRGRIYCGNTSRPRRVDTIAITSNEARTEFGSRTKDRH